MPIKQEQEFILITDDVPEDCEKSELIEDYKKLNDKVSNTLLKIRERKVKRARKVASA
jgi:hypothetical protein